MRSPGKFLGFLALGLGSESMLLIIYDTIDV